MIFTFCSGSGSPGVTTTVLALAYMWGRRAVVLEADPTGGNAISMGLLRAQVPKPGLLELKRHVDAGNGTQALLQVAIPLVDAEGNGVSRADLADSDRSWPDPLVAFIPGSTNPEQTRLLVNLWEPLFAAVHAVSKASGVDFLVDAGRLGMVGSPKPFVEASDVTVLCTRSSLREAAGAKGQAHRLLGGVTGEHKVAALLIGDGKPYPVKELVAALSLPDNPIVSAGRIAWDARRASVFSDGEPIALSKVRRSPFGGSVQATAQTLQQLAQPQEAS
jgi:hypothetical protein